MPFPIDAYHCPEMTGKKADFQIDALYFFPQKLFAC